MREMARANKFSANIEAANHARFEMEMKMGQLMDRFVPAVMLVSEKLSTTVYWIATGVDKIVSWLPGLGGDPTAAEQSTAELAFFNAGNTPIFGAPAVTSPAPTGGGVTPAGVS